MPIKEEKRAALTRWTREKLCPTWLLFYCWCCALF